MTEGGQSDRIQDLVRKFWWIILLVILLLLALCGFISREEILKLFNPPNPTETVTATPPPDQPTEVVDKKEQPTDPPTETSTDEATEVSTQPIGDGACNARCSPNASNCLAGLECLPSSADPDKFICWNQDICKPSGTEQPTESAGCACQGTTYICPGLPPSYNSTACGGGGQCFCEGTTLVCPDGTKAEFNPACGVGGTGGCTCVYNYAYYGFRCVENPAQTCVP